MIQTALTLGCSEAAGKEFAKDVVPKVRKAAKWRNKIAHGIWTIHEKYPDDLIWCAGTMSPTLASERYTKKDFLELWLRLLKAHEFLLTYALALPVRYPRRASEDPVPFWRPADSEASAESIADREG